MRFLALCYFGCQSFEVAKGGLLSLDPYPQSGHVTATIFISRSLQFSSELRSSCRNSLIYDCQTAVGKSRYDVLVAKDGCST